MIPISIELWRNSPLLLWKVDVDKLVGNGGVVTVTTTRTVGEEDFGAEESSVVVVVMVVAAAFVAGFAEAGTQC